MARKSDGHHTPKLDDLTPHRQDLIRGGDGEEKKKHGVNLGTITITKTYDKASPSL